MVLKKYFFYDLLVFMFFALGSCSLNPIFAESFQVGLSCEGQLEGLVRPPLPRRVQVVVETPRLLLVKASNFPDAMVHGIYERQTGLLVGNIVYLKTSPSVLELPLGLFSFAEGLGYATEAKFALMQFAFERNQIQWIEESILSSNTASIKLHEKLGYQKGPQGRWGVTRSIFLKVQKKLRTDFEGNFGLFSKPSHPRFLAQIVAHQYVQAAFEFHPIWAMGEFETLRHIVDKKIISPEEFAWIRKFIQLSSDLQKEIYYLLPAAYQKHLYVSLRSMLQSHLTWKGWDASRADLLPKLQTTFLFLESL